MRDVWTPFAPCSLEELSAYLQRAIGEGTGDPERVIRAGNHAVGHMELRTRRRLVSRTYREAVAVTSCTTTVDTLGVTGTGFSTYAKAGDEVVGVGLQPGTRVASVTSNTAIVLNRPATATGTVTLTFGSEPLQVDGTGKDYIYVPERPVQEIYGASYLDDSGAETALDTTGYRIERDTGRLVLPNDAFPEGDLNVLLEVSAGYAEPSATVRGDFGAWMALQHLFLRLAQVYFQDEQTMPGRVVDRKVLQAGGTIPDFRLPQDIQDLLVQFERRW